MPERCRILANFSQPRVELVLSALPHAARIQDDEIGVGLGGGLIALGLEQAGQTLAVMEVHLATERLDEVLSHAASLSLSLVWNFRFRLLLFVRPSTGIAACRG